MQFVKGGPDVSESLLQAHEDGRVVFFCGAGVSYPARLPGFAKLVRELYSRLGITPNAVQAAAIKDKRYDTAVGLLEANIVGERRAVREMLAEILEPDISAPNATATHAALLTLGKGRDRRTRLITTNFDRLFEHVIQNGGPSTERFEAPLLPVPKNRWDGLVYRRCFEAALERLTEREACRLAVTLLALAHEENCEAELAAEIDSILDEGRLPAPNDLKARFAPDPGKMPRIDVARTHLAGYGSLLSAGGAS